MRTIRSRSRQQGALMVVALIFLLIVSMLAMSTVDTTGLEMRMANNSRDQQMAFEAAEYTLSFVESQIFGVGFSEESLSNTGCGALCFTPDCAGGYCFAGSSYDDVIGCSPGSPATAFHEDPDIWDDENHHLTLDVPGAGVTTRYIVEYRCYTARDQTLPMDDTTNYTRVYRITVLATGQGGRGRVMLRSTMKES